METEAREESACSNASLSAIQQAQPGPTRLLGEAPEQGVRLLVRRGEVHTMRNQVKSPGWYLQTANCQHLHLGGLINTGPARSHQPWVLGGGPQPQGVQELSGKGLGAAVM